MLCTIYPKIPHSSNNQILHTMASMKGWLTSLLTLIVKVEYSSFLFNIILHAVQFDSEVGHAYILTFQLQKLILLSSSLLSSSYSFVCKMISCINLLSQKIVIIKYCSHCLKMYGTIS